MCRQIHFSITRYRLASGVNVLEFDDESAQKLQDVVHFLSSLDEFSRLQLSSEI